MKTFRPIISEVAQPSAEDELNFKEKHVIDHILDPNSEEEQFTADEIKKFRNRADYKKGEDMAVYEGITLTRRDLPGQEDSDVNNDGKSTMHDAQLRYRRHAQIKSKIIDEAKMSDAQIKKREEIVMAMKKNKSDMMKKYGKDWENVMYATATKQAMSEATDLSKAEWEKDSAKVAKSKDPKFVARMIEKWGLRGSDWLDHPALTGKMHEALDPVGKEDSDIDNDGKITKSDAYLRARRRAIAKKLQQEGLVDILQPTGGEYGDEETSHIAYKKKNRTSPDHAGESINEADLHEVSKKTLGRYIKAAGPDRERLMKRAKETSQLGHDVKKDGDTKKAQELFYRAGGDVLKAANRRSGINKAVDKLAKEDVSLSNGKTGLRIFAGKTNKSQISETFATGTFEFADGSYTRLVAEEANLLSTLMEALDGNNRERALAVAQSSKAGLDEIVRFARKVL